MTLDSQIKTPSFLDLSNIFQTVADALPEPECTASRADFMRRRMEQRPDLIETAERHQDWDVARHAYEYELARQVMHREACYLLRAISGDYDFAHRNFRNEPRELKNAIENLISTPVPTRYCLNEKRVIARRHRLSLGEEQLAAIFAADEEWLTARPHVCGRKPAAEPKPKPAAVEAATEAAAAIGQETPVEPAAPRSNNSPWAVVFDLELQEAQR